MGTYKRYRLIPKLAPHMYEVPHKFEPLIDKIALLKNLFGDFFHYLAIGLKEKKLRDYLKVLFDRPCQYGVFSGRFGGFRPKREKCVGCFECKIEYPHIVRDVVVNPNYKTLDKLGLTMDDIDTILFESETGMERVRGTGYKGPFAGEGFDSVWLDMSEIVRPTRDGKEGREYISTETQIGRKLKRLSDEKSKTVTLGLPIIFEYQETKNFDFHKAIASASVDAETYYIVSQETLINLKNFSHRLIPLIRSEDEIRNLDSEIIEFEVNSEKGLKRFSKLKGFNEDSVLIARFIAREDLKPLIFQFIEEGICGIHLVFRRDGLTFDKSIHIKDFLLSLHKELIERGLRSLISIIVSGGITKAEHVPKAMGCGADAVAIDLPLHIALQSIFFEKGEDYEIVPRRIDVEWGKQRILNLLSAWHEQLIEALSAMGKRDARRLVGDFGRLIFLEDMMRESFAGIERKNEFHRTYPQQA